LAEYTDVALPPIVNLDLSTIDGSDIIELPANPTTTVLGLNKLLILYFPLSKD